MRRKLIVGAAAGLLMLGAACGGSDDDGNGGTSSGGEEGSGGGTVALVAADLAFEPSELSASAGDTIEFTNEDDAPHTFTAEDAGIDEDVDPQGEVTISLEGVDPGSYDFVCTIHPDMTGTLEVTE